MLETDTMRARVYSRHAHIYAACMYIYLYRRVLMRPAGLPLIPLSRQEIDYAPATHNARRNTRHVPRELSLQCMLCMYHVRICVHVYYR